jgi:hypothetical protein
LSVKNENTEKALKKFLEYTINQAKANLSKKSNTGALANSLDYDVKVSKNSFEASIKGLDYASFVDLGVRGKTSSKKGNSKSPFKFGTGTGQSGGLTKGINTWVKQKGIQFREREGKGVKGQFLSYKQTSFLIVRSIWNKGMTPSFFLTKPFEKGFKELPEDIIEAYGLDVETFLKQIINNGKTS